MKMHYKHISKEEHEIIKKLTQAGSLNKKDCGGAWQSRSKIGRELKRNYGESTRSYEHVRAQKLADKRRKESNVSKISEKTWEKVFGLFKIDCSLEQIASVAEISHESIFYRIYAGIKIEYAAN